MGVIPKKRLGQHFLTVPYYCRRIAGAVPALPDEAVLEIGPGPGALSVCLRERFSRFHCVEKDGDVLPELRRKLGEGGHVIHHADALRFDFGLAGFPLHVVGNLPYSVASPIIKKTIFYGDRIRSCTFMVQKEVARRIVARPHTKTYGFLSVLCQYFGEARILFNVPPGAFFPPPRVESSVFQIIPDRGRMARLDETDWLPFFAFVTRGFSQRRKRLAKVLAGSKDGVDFTAILKRLGIGEDARAEDLGPDEWVRLYTESCRHA